MKKLYINVSLGRSGDTEINGVMHNISVFNASDVVDCKPFQSKATIDELRNEQDQTRQDIITSIEQQSCVKNLR